MFTYYPDLLDRFGQFFGVARGADALVYMSIIFLAYMYFQVMHAHTKDRQELTRFCTHDALRRFDAQWGVDALPRVDGALAEVWFLIRAYNEEATLGRVVEDIIGRGYTTIVVMNDGSQDRTWAIVNELQQAHPQVRLVHLEHTINRWGGAANKTLYAFVRQYSEALGMSWWVTLDADGQMSLDDMQTFAQYMDHTRYDVLLGSRFIAGGSASNIPPIRKVILRGGKILTWLFNGIWVSDGHNGYRVWHAPALAKIRVTSDGMLYANELNESIRRQRLRYREVPVHIVYTDYSLAKGQQNKNALRLLRELIYKKLFFR